MKALPWIVLVVVLAAGGGGLFWWYRRQQAQAEADAAAIQPAPVATSVKKKQPKGLLGAFGLKANKDTKDLLKFGMTTAGAVYGGPLGAKVGSAVGGSL